MICPADIYDEDKGICISDGLQDIDLETGEELGAIMTDDECAEISSRRLF